ncbi:MAG: transporter substrate-binding domain-containing protein [Lachnospiraceae bacterium]|nr:transporter substrate-binding domain-containing protein [Lachnospiraceae bacterium]
MKKRILALMMGVVTAATMLLAGCGKAAQPEETEGTENAESTETTEDTTDDDKVLKVAIECTFAPYNWTQETEEVANGDKAVKIKNTDGYAYGYDVKYAQRIADALGYELEIYKIEWTSIFMGLEDKTYDIIMSGICYTEERDETYDFTSAYYRRQIKAVVREDSEFADCTCLSDFDGLGATVTSQLGTTYVNFKDQIPGATMVTDYETASECFLAVQNQAADVCVLDYTTAVSAMGSIPGLKILTLDPEDDFVAMNGISNDCSMCFREGDPLRDIVQEVVDAMALTNDDMNEMMDEMITLQPSAN